MTTGAPTYARARQRSKPAGWGEMALLRGTAVLPRPTAREGILRPPHHPSAVRASRPQAPGVRLGPERVGAGPTALSLQTRVRPPFRRTLLSSSTPILVAYHATTAAAVRMGAILPSGLRKRVTKAGTGAPDADADADGGAARRAAAPLAGRAGRRVRREPALSGVAAATAAREAMGAIFGARSARANTSGWRH